eukprot:6536755-Alexandrium_andersonii.AAC.1
MPRSCGRWPTRSAAPRRRAGLTGVAPPLAFFSEELSFCAVAEGAVPSVAPCCSRGAFGAAP